MQNGAVKDFRYKLIPLFADAIAPDAEMAAAIEKARAPYAKELSRVVGTADSLLYRRGNFNGTFDDLICAALLKERDAEIALSPGFRWGTSVLPGAADHDRGHPQRYRDHLSAGLSAPMSGERLKEVLEDVADNLFNPDPYYQQGGDMVRCGGLGYAIDVSNRGQRISAMTLLKTGKADRSGQGLHGRRLGERNEGTKARRCGSWSSATSRPRKRCVLNSIPA